MYAVDFGDSFFAHRVDGLKEVRDFLGALLYPLLEEPPAMYTGQMTRRKRNRVVAEFQAIKNGGKEEKKRKPKMEEDNSESDGGSSDGRRKKRKKALDGKELQKDKADGENGGDKHRIDDTGAEADQPGAVPASLQSADAVVAADAPNEDEQPGAASGHDAAMDYDGKDDKEADASQMSTGSSADGGWSSDDFVEDGDWDAWMQEEEKDEKDGDPDYQQGDDGDEEDDDAEEEGDDDDDEDQDWTEKSKRQATRKRTAKGGKNGKDAKQETKKQTREKSGKDAKEESIAQVVKDDDVVSSVRQIFSSRRRVLLLSNAGSEALTLTAGKFVCVGSSVFPDIYIYIYIYAPHRHAGHQFKPAFCSDGLGSAGEPRAPHWQRQKRLHCGSSQWRCVVRGPGVSCCILAILYFATRSIGFACKHHSGT